MSSVERHFGIAVQLDLQYTGLEPGSTGRMGGDVVGHKIDTLCVGNGTCRSFLPTCVKSLSVHADKAVVGIFGITAMPEPES